MKVLLVNGSPHQNGCTHTALGKNMAWLLKSIEAGKQQGVIPPEEEKRINTNYIR